METHITSASMVFTGGSFGTMMQLISWPIALQKNNEEETIPAVALVIEVLSRIVARHALYPVLPI
jgi:hypothetical protein